MVEQVVGLRFVTEGAAEATASIKRLDQSQASLTGSISKSYGITKRTEAEVRKLTGAYVGGNLNLKQYYQALSQTSNAYGQFLGNTTLSRQQVEQLSSALLEEARSQGESTKAKAAAAAAARSAAISAKQEADSIRQYAEARRQANEANRRFDSEQANSAAAAARLEKAILDQGRAFAEAVRGATQYTQANKSAEGSASVFEAELRKQEAALQRTAKVNQEYLRSLQTSNQANKSAEDSASVFSAELRKQEAGLERAARANQEYMRSLQTASLANKSAEGSASVFEAELRRQEATVERLAMKYNPLRAASMLYEKELRDINEATRVGAINDRQRQQSLDALNAEFQSFSSGAQGAAMANNRFGAQSQMAGRRTNQLGVLMQQTGYQVGDFAVQVQGGTNVMVALGQQATQLVGTFGMLAKSTRMIGVFAGLGIAIPIITGVAAAFMRMNESAEEAAKDVKSLDDKLKSLKETLKNYAELQEAVAKGMSLDEYFTTKELDAAIRKLKEAKDDLKELTFGEALVEGGLRGVPLIGNLIAGETETEAYEAALKRVTDAEAVLAELRQKEADTRADNFADSSLKLKQELEILQAQADFGKDSPQSINKELEQELRIRKEAIDAKVVALELDYEAGEELKRQIQRAADLLALVKENTAEEERRLSSIELFYQNQQNSLDIERDRATAVRDIISARDTEVNSLNEQVRLNSAILQYGKESSQVAVIVAEQARAQYEAQQKSNGVLGNNLDAVMAIYDENVKITAEIRSSEAAGKGLAQALREAASAMASLSGFSAGLDKALAVSVAKVNALKRGTDEAIAGQIAGMRVDLEAKSQAAISSGNDPLLVMAESAIGKSTIDAIEASETERKRLIAAQRTSGGSSGGGAGKSNVIDIQEIIAKRNEQIAQERVLLGLTGQQRAEMEIYYDLTKGMSDEQLASSEQFVMAESKKIAALQQTNDALKEQRAEQQQIADTISSSMGSAFMSIIDGTKSVGDAFKDMARAIIAELVQVLIVKRAVSAVTSFLGFADGGVFSGGNVIPFANGGVVNSPMTFPMSGGKMGLMGEAGPEAIMPLKRGKDGKLGVAAEGSGAVTVVQHFNFSANGDDSVKKIIAQAAPQIANMAKASLLNDRRRGGSTKAAFG